MSARDDLRATAVALQRAYECVFGVDESSPTLDVERIEHARQRTTGRVHQLDPQLTLDLTPRKDS